MSELTDLEICKRIAKIEGVVVYREANQFYGDNYFRDDIHHDLAPVVYNPLTDDALCFRLMVDYRVYCEPFMFNDSWSCRASSFNNSKGEGYVNNMNLNRAICLAIIEFKAVA